jgi:hypothetical protein
LKKLDKKLLNNEQLETFEELFALIEQIEKEREEDI